MKNDKADRELNDRIGQCIPNISEAPDYRLPLHHPKNNTGTTSAISPATQEIIAKEIAKHLDEALRGVERILFNHGMRLDTKTRSEMSELQTDIKTSLQTLVRRWKL